MTKNRSQAPALKTYKHNKKYFLFSNFHVFFSLFNFRFLCSLFRSALCALRCACFFLIIFACASCYKSPPPVTELSEAHIKFEQLCEEDYNINTVTEHFPNTLYVYVPVHFDLLKTRAARPDPFAKPQAGQKRQVNLAETAFENEQFHIQYDISTVNTYPKILGYGSAYTDQFSALHNNLLSALMRAYGDLDKAQTPMDFVVVLIIDVRNGIGIKNVFHFKDLQMAMTQALPQDEYVKRYMTEMTGNEKYINNTTAHQLDFHDMTWPEFIAEQITYRIKFKYERSGFPPEGNDVDEILKIIHAAISAYDFEGFENIELNDLANEETYLFDRNKLKTFESDT